MKSVGNIRFIGELFKQQMLTVSIILRCLHNLLDNKEEKSLECLCELLTTIGKELEVVKKIDLSKIFDTIKDIVDKKHGKVGSRVRFMLQDVIDVRKNKWISRRQDSNPKFLDQIQKEADHEQLNIQALNSVPMLRKDEHNSNTLNTERKHGRNAPDDICWSRATSRNRQQMFGIISDKLRINMPQADEPLGSTQIYSTWMRGLNIKTTQATLPTNTNNMYAALENITDTDKRPLGSRPNSKDLYCSKGPSLERRYKYEEGRSSRSGSQHRSGDSSVTSSQSNLSTIVSNVPKSEQPLQSSPIMDVLALERKIKNILEEYLCDCCRVDECNQDIKESIPPTYLPKLVSDGYVNVLERSNTARIKTGNLFAQLIKLGTLSEDNYCIDLEELLAQADDLTIDIPKVWDYLAEIIAPLLCEEATSFSRLQKSFEILIEQGHAPKLLVPLFKLVVKDKGPNFLHNLWRSSNASLFSFMPSEQVDGFVKDNKFEFLLG